MRKEERIVGEKKDISYDAVWKFFEERGKTEKKHILNYVMYLDDEPEVAIERDRQVKEKLERFICVKPGMRVLDLGCGVGRCAPFFLEKGAYYVGVDGSREMIDKAKNYLREYDNKKLIVTNLIDLSNALINENEKHPFDVIFDSGVLMYLNDADCVNVLKTIAKLGGNDSTICVIESMSQDSRLTLNEYYSSELKQNYSAIYRSESEYRKIFEDSLGTLYFLKCDEIFDFEDGLQKKREHVTMEHCFVWEHCI